MLNWRRNIPKFSPTFEKQGGRPKSGPSVFTRTTPDAIHIEIIHAVRKLYLSMFNIISFSKADGVNLFSYPLAPPPPQKNLCIDVKSGPEFVAVLL